MGRTSSALVQIITTAVCAGTLQAAPHGQAREPGPALTPDQAIAKMELAPGFKVECVAREPDVINPTSFTFDDRGRIWVTESVEYPRASAGKGQDRVKILEDVNHNGHYDKVTIFKEGLNIPCGVVLGNGGVYITNSPDILFLQDTDGDGHANKEEVILTGFGRDDRHELPNNLTWGPDGWLYGLNGVFNRASVKFEGKTYDFTCAIWRYHPQRKKFELFAEGTSNPWGLDYNRQGDWFVSCCVIDHLFHMTQSGYYQRQGGPYPPLTQILPSITTQRHQAAAYGGLCIYDAEAFPEEYRNTLIMGNLHGSCLNRDVLTREGSTYVQHNAPADFLSANDAWFMPVAQKVGPDGCLYVMDWYDRYHCYQDAGRDPQGIDRKQGRIYRISYNGTPRTEPFDLQKMSNAELLKLLGNSNVWWRRQAQRVLHEKFERSLVPELQRMALDASDKTQAHLHALWLLISAGDLDPSFHEQVMSSADEPTRNWGARAVGQMERVTPAVYAKLKSLAQDPSPDVRLQVAVAAGRLAEPDPLPILMASLDNPDNVKDKLIPTILYNNLKLLAPTRAEAILAALGKDDAAQRNFGSTVVRWTRDAVNALGRRPEQVVGDLKKALSSGDSDARKLTDSLRTTIDALAAGGVKPTDRAKLFDDATRQEVATLTERDGSARVPAVLIAMWWNDAKALVAARSIVADPKVDAPVRAQILRALAEHKEPANIDAFAAFIADGSAPVLLRQNAVDALGEMNDARAAGVLIDAMPKLGTDLKPMAMNALVRSKAGSSALLIALAEKKVPPQDVNENHARRMLAYNDPELAKQVTKVWGSVRTDRDPERVKIAAEMKALVQKHPAGDAKAGWRVFETRCMQCHTIYGHGGDVGPDLTGVGRENLDAILSNVIDPNLVVGAPYYQYVVKLKNGTVATGLLAEDSAQRVLLKDGTQKLSISRADVKEIRATTLSMMPEGLEKTMNEDEFCNLVAFLLTREPPK